MKKLLLFFCLFCFSCNEQNENQTAPVNLESNVESTYLNTNYNNGTFCAEIEYYNPRTGTNSSYTLTVEVDNGRLVNIEWPNGGWLDESHYSDVEISESGNASFESDKGYQYTVHIISSNACSYENEFSSEEDENDNSKKYKVDESEEDDQE